MVEPGIPEPAVHHAARRALAWSRSTPIRAYLYTEHLTIDDLAPVLAEHRAVHAGTYDMGIDLAWRTLVVTGHDPDALIGLGHHARLPHAPATLRVLLRLARHPEPLTESDADRFLRHGLTLGDLDAWVGRFDRDSLDQCLAAGLTAAEIRQALDRQERPAADLLAMLAALRATTP